ncbi:unnamed protein product [Moneuplotes crassus]|uniref:Uncharacterized protein n=1 Tax=Euplotes crassus TaxID=5936 RepID=A0AAD1UH26_EUPCR|nr:unnamed protein product [Moneuplotes crassus]
MNMPRQRRTSEVASPRYKEFFGTMENCFNTENKHNQDNTNVMDCFYTDNMRDKIMKSPDFKQNSEEKQVSQNDDAYTLDLQEPVRDITDASRTFKSNQSQKSASTFTQNLRTITTDSFKITLKYWKLWKKYVAKRRKNREILQRKSAYFGLTKEQIKAHKFQRLIMAINYNEQCMLSKAFVSFQMYSNTMRSLKRSLKYEEAYSSSQEDCEQYSSNMKFEYQESSPEAPTRDVLTPKQVAVKFHREHLILKGFYSWYAVSGN